ncbi:unnamed protein product [Macrosiphum euphorbiae]|uniref:Uncharacterized protein n=1 Tax=Macrosiphum euphorbiae TaxID=13131 RepID=A0AAV0XGL6_9HEMI|nr:unnamed protein product [Macrosiphum euphorbiae]
MAIVDAAINHPLALSAENVVAVDPIAVSQKTPSTEPEDILQDDDRVRSSARNDSWPSEPETGTEDSKPQANKGRRRFTFWCRTMRFVGRMFCCGA